MNQSNSNSPSLLIIAFALLFSISIANFGFSYSIKKNAAKNTNKEDISALINDEIKKIYSSSEFKEAIQGSVKSNLQELFAAQQQPTQNGKPPEKVEVSIDDDPIQGDKEAPVTIVEFSDYQCPFCKRAFDDAVKQIREKYIANGKVRLVYRDYPLDFHQYALPAAMAAECADDQGKYFEMHDKLFENQQALTDDDLIKYANEIGLKEAEFTKCFKDQKYKDEVLNDLKDGQKAGVGGTPAFFINGTVIEGAQPFSAFEKIIEEELKNK